VLTDKPVEKRLVAATELQRLREADKAVKLAP
jgi:hypothetical protein